jgi:hypothetical protein
MFSKFIEINENIPTINGNIKVKDLKIEDIILMQMEIQQI